MATTEVTASQAVAGQGPRPLARVSTTIAATARCDGFTPTCSVWTPPVINCCGAGLELPDLDDLRLGLPMGNSRPGALLAQRSLGPPPPPSRESEWIWLHPRCLQPVDPTKVGQSAIRAGSAADHRPSAFASGLASRLNERVESAGSARDNDVLPGRSASMGFCDWARPQIGRAHV